MTLKAGRPVLLWVFGGFLSLAPVFSLQAAEQPQPVTKEGSAEFRKVVRQVLPAVVSITSVTTDSLATRFKKFRPDNNNSEEEMESTIAFGSGAIIDKRGYILTNSHVVEDAKRVTVTLQDGSEFEATDIIRDPKTDVAIIRLKPEDVAKAELPVAELGDSDKSEIGDWVLAIGSPFGLSGSVTSGIISGKGRAPNELDIMYKDFIQTDAAINPGNSGGPLVDLDGRIIGINTAIRSNTGTFGGIGFAIPSNMARRVSDQLIANGKVKRSYLGIEMKKLTKKIQTEKHVSSGVEVSNLASGETPAKKAGLLPKDVILSVDGDEIGNEDELRNLVSMTPPGQTVTMKVLRGADTIDVPVILEEQPEKFGMEKGLSPPIEGLGIAVQELEGKLRVVGIPPGSAAEKAGVDIGDVIQQVEHKDVHNVEELTKVVAETEGDLLLRIIKSNGSPKVVVIKR